jgi:hypothetical protein
MTYRETPMVEQEIDVPDGVIVLDPDAEEAKYSHDPIIGEEEEDS